VLTHQWKQHIAARVQGMDCRHDSSKYKSLRTVKACTRRRQRNDGNRDRFWPIGACSDGQITAKGSLESQTSAKGYPGRTSLLARVFT
jgi:hypothetical protein